MRLWWLTARCGLTSAFSLGNPAKPLVRQIAPYASKAAKASSAELESRPNLNVGTIGHIDHGKTTLTAAITRFLSTRGKTKFVKFDEIDNAKEEQRRGITMNAAHIGYETASRRYAHTDCPGHADFIKNMICGTAQMDAAILVIAASEGVMAQTKEHLLLARELGVPHIIVFVNKVDLVDSDILDLVELETLDLLGEFGYSRDSVTFVKGSALQALEGGDCKCIDELLTALDAIPLPKRIEDAPLLMPVTSRMPIQGRGTVIIGTVEEGCLRKGDKVDIKGPEGVIQTVVREIQVFGKTVDQVKAGEHCGVLCRGLKPELIHRGMWLGAPGTIQTTNLCKVELYLLPESESGKQRGLRSGFTDKVFCTTWEQVGRFCFANDLLMPGEHCTAYVGLQKEMPIKQSLTFTLREVKDKRTVAKGVIRELLPSFEGDLKTINHYVEDFLKPKDKLK